MSYRNHVTAAVGLVLLTSALAFGFWPKEKEATKRPESTPTVRVAPVKLHTSGRSVRFAGIMRSARTAKLSNNTLVCLGEMCRMKL